MLQRKPDQTERRMSIMVRLAVLKLAKHQMHEFWAVLLDLEMLNSTVGTYDDVIDALMILGDAVGVSENG